MTNVDADVAVELHGMVFGRTSFPTMFLNPFKQRNLLRFRLHSVGGRAVVIKIFPILEIARKTTRFDSFIV